MVVSVKERRSKLRWMSVKETCKRTTDDVSKATSDDTKTRVGLMLWDENSRGTCLLLEWYPA